MDYFCILNKGGIVLYSKSWEGGVRGSPHPVDDLISSVLLEGRLSLDSFTSSTYQLRWLLDNNHHLIYVVVYNKFLPCPMSFTSDLLNTASSLFQTKFATELAGNDVVRDLTPKHVEQVFGPEFERLYSLLEKNTDFSGAASISPSVPVGGDAPKPAKSPQGFKKNKGTTSQKTEKKPSKKKKEDRVWEDEFAAGDEKMYSRNPEGDAAFDDTKDEHEILDELKFDVDAELVSYEGEGGEMDEVAQHLEKSRQGRKKAAAAAKAAAEGAPAEKRSAASGMWNFFGSIATGGRELTRDDIQPVVLKFKKHLQSKNVALEITEKLCESVTESLAGKKIGTFQGVSSAVRRSLEESMTRILTPSRNIDLIRDVTAHRKEHPDVPFSLVFMGCNGVGKSTNLAKIGSYLRKSGFSVMFAACDTFRSGAVEQLKVHSKRLGIDLFEKGYGRDDTGIAQDALALAKKEGIDVVLIDTAGRMQDKEPLMRAISKLVNTVQPNLVLFVGEALVGNEAVDQLTKFNQALLNAGTAFVRAGAKPRLIDGIVLTKFDTVDDKVGSAVSMVYTTGVPIVFLGTGQHYTDLKKLNVSSVVNTLLR